MKPPPNRTMSARADPKGERRAMTALLAVFALLVQALVATPAMAMAMGGPAKAHGAFGEIAICTSHGLQTITADGTAPPQDDSAGGGSCGHCVCPPVVSLAPPLPTGLSPRGAYGETPPALGPSAQAPPPARAPPRPFGQGPPSPNA